MAFFGLGIDGLYLLPILDHPTRYARLLVEHFIELIVDMFHRAVDAGFQRGVYDDLLKLESFAVLCLSFLRSPNYRPKKQA